MSPSLIIDKGNFGEIVNGELSQKDLGLLTWNGDTAFTNHPELFYDMTHLNAKGAEVFTRDFIKRVKGNI